MRQGYKYLVLLLVLVLPVYFAPMAHGQEIIAGPHEQAWNYVTDLMLLEADKDPNNWIIYGRDYALTRYSPLTEINKDNVRQLVPLYTFSFGRLQAQNSIAMVYNGMLYVTSAFNRVFCLDAATGKEIWRYEHELPADVYPYLCCDVINRGVCMYHDKVYLAALDCRMVALNNVTGEVIWDKVYGDYHGNYSFALMPLVVKGKLIVGPQGAEFGIRGWTLAIDAETGEEVWRFYNVPGPGDRNFIIEAGPNQGNPNYPGDSWKTGGGSIWTTASYDAELDLLYQPIGNPSPDFDRHVRSGAPPGDPNFKCDNLYTASTIVLDPDDGELKFWFQYTPNDPYDYDSIGEALLIDDQETGQKCWLMANRNGYFYKIDRTNGKYIQAITYCEVNVWKGIDENGRVIPNWPEMDVVRDRVTKDIKPILDGGKNWHPMAYSPVTDLCYIPSFNRSMDMQAAEQEFVRGEWFLGLRLIKQNTGNDQFKAIKCSGDMEVAFSVTNPYPVKGGALVTAGGIVFTGTADGEIWVLDAETGEKLRVFQVGTGVHGQFSTFNVRGKQYVAVPVGPGGGGLWWEMRGEYLKHYSLGGMLFVFGLMD
jgi:alcohol dehydrogenase (cytochrome c)